MQEMDAAPYLDIVTRLGEGPRWDGVKQRLLFVDILAGIVYECDVAAESVRSFHVGQHVGAVAPRASGGFVVAVQEGFGSIGEGGEYRPISTPYRKRFDVRMNDGACDPVGRFFAGSMAYDGSPGAGELWRLDWDGTCQRVLSDVSISNGIGWSADGNTCYYTDTPTRRIDSFVYDVSRGGLSERQVFANLACLEGIPDGLTLDSEGGVWVALYGGNSIVRLGDNGALTFTVTVPGAALVTACTFGGPDLDRLYITTAQEPMSESERMVQSHAGRLFVCKPGWTGFAAVPYAG